jgi:hypothetical protein
MRRLVGLVTVALVAMTLVAVRPAVADAGQEADFVSRANGARANSGAGSLKVDGELTAIARRWSGKMAAANQLSHNPNLSKEVSADWEKLAENVGFGPSVESIHQAFMNSAGHRANILDSALTHIGVGVVVDGDGQIWVTEVFMRLRGGAGGGGTPATTAAPPPPTTAKPKPVTTAPPATAPRTTAASKPKVTAPPATAPATTAAPPPVTVPEPPPLPPDPTPRLVLVLDQLRALDGGR